MKILVVEDHRALQEGVVNYLKEHLSQSISEILTASDGEEALRILKTQPIDYLITDLNLPKINGLDLISFFTDCSVLRCFFLRVSIFLKLE